MDSSQSAKGLEVAPESSSSSMSRSDFDTVLLAELKQVVEGCVLIRDAEKKCLPKMDSSPARSASTTLPPYPSAKVTLGKNETEFSSSTRVFNSAAQVVASFVVRPRHTKDVVE